jgi:cysteine desulfurase/selenocysteine lyase
MNNVEELIEDFQDLDDREANQMLDELGRELPEIPDAVRRDEFLVPGCQSRVWLVAELDGTPETGSVQITADSDAIVVKGLIFVAKEIFNGRTPREILDADYQSVFDRMGVGRLITPQRKNGLNSVIRRIRTFAATALGEPADGESTEETTPTQPTIVEPTRSIDGIKSAFPILNQTLPGERKVVYLDSGASAQKPTCVIDKEQEVERQYFANAFRGTYYFGSRVDDEIESARESVRRLLNARSTSEIVFTAGTTMGINLIAQGWGCEHIKAGDEIVLTEMEHHANHVPWQMVAKEVGATLKFLPMTDDLQLDESQFENVITDKCKLVAVTGMSNVLGTVNPIKQLADRAHAVGARILVDAAQTVPHQRVDVQADDVDFLVFSGHKLYGPTGVGVLYGKKAALEEVRPLFGGGHMIQSVGLEESTYAELPARLEAGTMPIVQIIGLGAAVQFVESVGFEAMHEHEMNLLRYAHEKLAAISGVTIYGPAIAHKGAIVSFTVDGISAEDLANRLDAAGVFTRHGHHCTMPLHKKLNVPATTRASFGIYNTMSDVDALVEVILAAKE